MTDGLIINGARVAVLGVRVVTWEDDPRVPKAVHGAPRSSADVVASIVHTSRGKDARITRETGSPAKGLRVARYLGRANTRQVSAHLVVAGDGTVYQIADLGAWRCNHAGAVNNWTWGVEVSQDDDDPSLTRAQVAALCAVMHVAHDALRIPKRRASARSKRRTMTTPPRGPRCPRGSTPRSRSTRAKTSPTTSPRSPARRPQCSRPSA